MCSIRNKAKVRIITKRKLLIKGTSVLTGLAAASVPILAQGQGRVTPQEQNYTAKERANLEAMKSYFDGLKTKDVSRVRFAANVTFTTAIIPRPEKGEAAVRKLTDGFANRLLNVRVDRYIIDDDFGCARFEIDWPENVIAHSINYFTFSNGQITSIEVYWNPREYLALQKRTSALPLDSLSPHHVALSVPNFEETLLWYQDKLNFRVVKRLELPQIKTKQAILERNAFGVEVFARENSTCSQPPAVTVPDNLLIQGVKHVAFMVDDLEAVAAELDSRGVKLVWGPEVNKDIRLKLGFIKDNNGNLIELVEKLEPNLSTSKKDTESLLTQEEVRL